MKLVQQAGDRHGVAEVAIFGLLLVGVGLLVPVAGYGVAAIAAAMTVAIIAVTTGHGGAAGLALALVVAAAATAPLNGLRVADVLTMSDAFLLVAFGIVLSIRVMRPISVSWRYYRAFIIAAVVTFYGGLIGTLAVDYAWQGVGDLVRYGISTVGVLVMFALWAPTVAQVRAVAWAFLIGTGANALLGTLFIRDGAGRAIGLAAHSNHFAVASLLACGTGIGLVLTSRGRSRTTAVGLMALVLGGLVGSGSRAGLGGAVVFAIVLAVLLRQWRMFLWAGFASVMFAVLVVVGIVELTSTSAVGRLLGRDATVVLSNAERSIAQEAALRSVSSHPITGVGFSAAKEAHNVYLQIWAAAGVLGLLGAAGLFIAVGRMVRVRSQGGIMATACLSSYIGYLASAVFSTVLWDRYLWLHVAITVGFFTASAEGISRTVTTDDFSPVGVPERPSSRPTA